MPKEKPNNQTKSPEEGYIIIPNSFFKEWTGILGDGPLLLYLELLTYCHKDQDTAWPTLKTLSRGLHRSTKSITRHHQKLVKTGLIKKVAKSKVASGNYVRNIYQLTHPKGTKMSLSRGTFVPHIGDKNVPNLGTNCPLNNTNKQNQYNNQDAVVDFKKLREEGEEKMQAIREQLRDLDFKESFLEKILKDYPAEKIEEKLELLLIKTNIQNPAGWLMAALKNDYQDVEEESQPLRIDSRFRGNDIKGSGNDINTPEQVSRKKALEAIKLIQDNLSTCISPLPNVGVRFIEPANLRGG